MTTPHESKLIDRADAAQANLDGNSTRDDLRVGDVGGDPRGSGESEGDEEGRARARRTWGSSPTGWTAAGEHEPGTPEFFEKAMRNRLEHEQPWLASVVPFHAMRGKRVLEIGFGPGFDAYTLLTAGAEYTGVDLTPENLERTRKHLAQHGLAPDVHLGDAERLPFGDASFDVAYSNGVLHHVPNIERAFAEAHRVLRPGGDFHVLLYHRNSLFYRVTLAIWYQLIHGGWRHETLRERLSRIEANPAGERPIVNVYSRRELRGLLKRTGFEVQSIRVRKLTWEELPSIWFVHRFFRHIPRAPLDALGRLVGWYVIGHGVKR